MKLVCDSCGTKYSIGDDRVAGKVFKIRCKKCANVMVVRGAAAEPAASEPIASEQSGDWHAVIDGMQSGPFTRVELLRKHASGELDHDTFVWREGLADWVALATLEELRAELAATPASEVTAVTSTPVAEAPAAARLLNERNESSVLFTLGNLAKLATPPTRATPATATASGTEGSGLIDIRALASTYAPAKANAKPASTIGSMEDLPVYSPATFGEPLVLVPNARPKNPDRRVLIALMATLAMLAVLAVVLVLVVLRKPDVAEAAGDSTAGTRVATLDPRGQGDGTPTGTANAGTPNTGTQNAGTPNTAPNGNTNAGTPNAPTPTLTTPTRTTPTTRTTRTPPSTPSRTTPTRTPTLTPDKEPNSCTDVACAFNNYKDDCCKVFRPGGKNPPPMQPPPSGELHENLDRGQLASGIATIRAQSCGGKSSARGDVNASVKVSAAGTVIGVTILSSPDPALSSCVTAAAQKGTFAKTKRGGSFKYVWRF